MFKLCLISTPKSPLTNLKDFAIILADNFWYINAKKEVKMSKKIFTFPVECSCGFKGELRGTSIHDIDPSLIDFLKNKHDDYLEENDLWDVCHDEEFPWTCLKEPASAFVSRAFSEIYPEKLN